MVVSRDGDGEEDGDLKRKLGEAERSRTKQ